MRRCEIEGIAACLPKGRTPFYYFKDRYALMLLSMFLDGKTSKADISKTSFGKLLQKPTVRDAISQVGSGELSPLVFDAHWPGCHECYLLTLGHWGSARRTYDQTSRSGYNLVLRLNFSTKHDEVYQQTFRQLSRRPFEYQHHPVHSGARNTLAWARLDIDLNTGDALIEEIQNDWLRLAQRARRFAAMGIANLRHEEGEIAPEDVIDYVDKILQPHREIWQEAMLAATIWFLKTELGMERIFYHTFQTGLALKRMSHWLPPRSIYTSLPGKFCFQRTRRMPRFLKSRAKSTTSPEYGIQFEFNMLAPNQAVESRLTEIH